MNRVCQLPLRLILLVLALVTVVQFGLSAVAFYGRGSEAEGYAMLLPDRIATIVETVESVPDDQRAGYLDVLQREDLSITIAEEPPGNSDEPSVGVPSVEAFMSAYDRTFEGREVRVWLAVPEGERASVPRLERLRTWSRHPMRIAVPLVTGEWILFESTGYHPEAVFGWQPGFAAGLLGAVIALLAVLVLWRSLGPMEEMSRRVSKFADDAKPVALDVRGAPETRKVAEAINHMQQRIAALIQEREVVFAAVSHDLRTHLTRLRLRIDRLPEGDIKSKSASDLEAMSAIVDDHLLLARVNAVEPTLDTVDLASLAARTAAARRLRLTQPQEGAQALIKGDASLIVRAIENLVGNALKYAGGAELKLVEAGGTYTLDVLDRGEGVSAADRERLVRPFQSGAQGVERDPTGHGLGLAIVSRIAERHGATFALLDRPGGGLIARLTFPRVDV
ncbi:HAMP domain-containing protein [bacterium]|nr:HAMP domain-containing protein [bacterium]